MGPNVKLKCLLIFLAQGLSLVLCKSPGYVILAPNVFHVGLEETIAVTVTDVAKPVKVKLFLQEFPNRRTNFSHVEGFFRSDKSGLLKIKVNPRDVPSHDTEYNQYLYLVASCNDPQLVFHKEVKILLNYRDKIVLLQTDKPIYTPKQTVKFRVIPLDFNLRPSKDKVNIFIKNPQGILAQRWANVSSETGFITKALHLGDHSLIGNWTIVITYGYLNSQNTTVKFEVKEYVLPRFSLRIIGPSYILPSAKRIDIAIVAKYTYGKPVIGSVITRLTITGKGEIEVKFFVNSSKLNDGKVQLKIDTSLLKNHALRPWFPNGRRLRIDADVVEQATGTRESAVDSSIYFVKTPFHLNYENTAMYFKPAMPYAIKIDVKYPNKRPASHLPVQISAKGTSDAGKPVNVMQKLNDRIRKYMKGNTDGQGRVEFILDVPRSVKDIEIEVETKDARLGKANAAVKFKAKAYNSPSKSYLHIRPKNPKGRVGAVSMWDVFQNGNISSLTFMVLSRGRILLQVLTRPKDGVNVVSTITFTVTKEMSPACRVLAFYVTKDNEVVADSDVMEVEERFPNKVRFTSPGKQVKKERPGMDYVIEVESTPGSRVGLLGIDESVYLLRNKNRLTKKKVFKDVKNLDLGCGVGPGKNNQDVFKNSGLMVITNAMESMKERANFGCSAAETKRRKRSLSYQEKNSCCLNGKLFSRASCVMRARFMAMNGVSLECREVFLNCCRIAWNEKAPVVDKRQRQFFEQNNGLFFGGEDNDIQSEQIRKYFPETWIFDEEIIGPDGRMMLPVTLPDTITTWVLQAISISNTSGFAMTSPSRITTFKKFFVTLSLPYSVQRGEQLSIVATIFNYGEEMSQFDVSLSGSREFCSTERPGDKTKPITLSVKANDAKSVTFPIVPIQLGKIPIRVSATRNMFGIGAVGSDIIQKDLLVVPEGVQRRFVHSLVLDPQGVLRDEKQTKQNVTTPAPTLKSARIVQDGQQINTVMLTVPSRSIPGSIKASIYLTGNLIGPVVTNLIKGGLENILRMPMGCGEQNMIFLAPNVYVLEYLTNTRQVTAEVEARAYRFIQQGYQQELGFRRTDKSFSAFGETRPGSTWLTAFVVKVFCAARKFDGVAIDDHLVCDSMKWLISNQRLDGAFPEVHDLVHKSLLGGVHGDVAMTAFVLTALLECKCSSQNSEVSIRKAVQYLETELASLNKAHVLALTTYSLALAKSTASSGANQRLFQMSSFDKDQNTRHWDVGGPALNVEIAGYALLAQLHLGRLKHGGPIVKWLTEQRNAEGGFVSTQDTCVALQALAKYSEKTAGAQLDLRVSITPEKDAVWRRTFHVEKRNALMRRKVDITPFLGGELFIDSSGTGVGQMQIEIVHNVPSSKNETCLFDLRVSVREEFDDNKVSDDGLFIVGRSARRTKRGLRSRRKKKTSKRCKRRKGKKSRHCRKPKSKKGSKKSIKKKKPRKSKKRRILKKKNEKKKEKEQKTQARAPDSLSVEVCTRYRKPGKSGMTIMDIGIFTGFEPDEKSLIELKKNVQPTVDRFEISDRSIVLYISEVFSSKEFCAHFKVNRLFGIGAVQPVPIKVYDYYEPGDSCTKFYAPDLKSELRLGICKGEQCKCTQDACSSCNIESLDVDLMLKKACRDHEFVFKGEIALVDEDSKGSQSWLNYFITVQKIFKQLDKSKLNVGDHIEYKKRAGCRCPELSERGEYLFMGQERNGKQYVLDRKTFVVPWRGKTRDEQSMIVAFRARMNRGHTCPLQ